MTLGAIQSWGNILASPCGLLDALAGGALDISRQSLSAFQIANGYQVAALAALPTPPRQILCGIAGRSLALESARALSESRSDEDSGAIRKCLSQIGGLHAKLPVALLAGIPLHEIGISPEDTFRRSMEVYWGTLLQNADLLSPETIAGWAPTPVTMTGFDHALATLVESIRPQYKGTPTAAKLLSLGLTLATSDTNTGHVIGEIAKTLLGHTKYWRGIACKLYDEGFYPREIAVILRYPRGRIRTDILATRKIGKMNDDKRTPAEIAAEIRTALPYVTSFRQLCRKVRLSRDRCAKIRRKFRIEVPPGIEPWRYRPEIDTLIDEGLSLDEICQRLGIKHRQVIEQYIFMSGQRAYWRERRREVKQGVRDDRTNLDSLRSELLVQITAHTTEEAQKAGFAYTKAVEYLNARKNHGDHYLKLRQLLKLFSRYERAVRNGRKISLEELAAGTGISYPYAGRILKAADLDLPSGRQTPHRFSDEEEAAIQRAAATQFSTNDVIYFLKLCCSYKAIHPRLSGYRAKRVIWKKTLGFSGHKVTLRIASQIYEAADLGSKADEIPRLPGAHSDVVDYALAHRDEIAGIIMDSLKTILERDISTPYL